MERRLMCVNSNLIKKIREMSEASSPLFPMAGASARGPVQRPV